MPSDLKKRTPRLLITALVVLTSGLAPAETTYSLPELVDRALAQSELLESHRARVEEKRLLARQAGVPANPELGAFLGKKTEGGKEGSAFEVEVSQPLLFPGKRGLRRDVASLDAEAAAWDLTEAQVLLHHEVVRLAYGYATAARQEALSRKRLKRFELMKAFIESHPFPSPQLRTERALVEQRLRGLLADAAEAEQAGKAAWIHLNRYAGLSRESGGRIQAPWIRGDKQTPKETLMGKAVGQNPGLAKQRLLIRQAEQAARLASREGMPDVDVFARYGEEQAGTNERILGGGLRFDLPVLNRNATAAQGLRSKMRAEEALHRFQQRNLERHIETLFSKLELARILVRQYPETVFFQWEEDLSRAEKGFRQGRVDLLNFLELDAQTFESYRRAIEAQLSYVHAYTELFLLAGERVFP